MVFEGELAIKLHSKDVNVVISKKGNPKQDQVSIGGSKVQDLPTTKALVC